MKFVRDVMLCFMKPGDKDVFFHSITQAYSEKKIRVIPTGVEPMTLRLLVQMLYH